MKRNSKDFFKDYLNKLIKDAQGAPSGEDLLLQFERGDYSSLDPEILQATEDKSKAPLDKDTEL